MILLFDLFKGGAIFTWLSPSLLSSPNFNSLATKKVINFDTTPIVDVVNYILIEASRKNASDIHFDPREDGMMVRFRIKRR